MRLETPVSVTHSASRLTGRLFTRRLFTVIPFAVIAIGAAVLGAYGRVPDGQVAPGVRVGDLDLGGRPLTEARTALAQWADRQIETPVLLQFPAETGIQRKWKTQARRLGLGLDTHALYDAVAKAGREGVLGQVSTFVSGAKQIVIAPPVTVDAAKLRAYLQRIARSALHPAKNARLIPSGDGFVIARDAPGLGMDMEASTAAVTSAWNQFYAASPPPAGAAPESGSPASGNTGGESAKATSQAASGSPQTETPSASTPENAAPKALTVTLTARATPAAITAQDLQQIDGPLGGYTTHFGGTGVSRGSNIALAVSHINGTLLQPGEVFSYNKVVGPRSGRAGFRMAPVIVHGELVPGIGGGICQVSSTLYNAVLLSDLKIVRRSHHAFPVHYLPAGRDATVVDGAIDFQFQNSTPAPIYIAGSTHRGRLTFRIYGKRVPGQEVSIELAGHTVQPAPVETERDPSVRAGHRVVVDKGHRGHRVTVYRVVRRNGEVVQRELISHDHYRPVPALVRIGTKSAPKKTQPAVSPPAAAPTGKAPVTPSPPSPGAPPGA